MYGLFRLLVSVMFFSAIIIMTCQNRAWAERPYLTCDPPPEGEWVEWYEVQGLPETYIVRKIPRKASASEGFHLDLTDLPPGGGPYTITARACNIWVGCSEWSEPLVMEATPEQCSKGRMSGKSVVSRQ